MANRAHTPQVPIIQSRKQFKLKPCTTSCRMLLIRMSTREILSVYRARTESKLRLISLKRSLKVPRSNWNLKEKRTAIHLRRMKVSVSPNEAVHVKDVSNKTRAIKTKATNRKALISSLTRLASAEHIEVPNINAPLEFINSSSKHLTNTSRPPLSMKWPVITIRAI